MKLIGSQVALCFCPEMNSDKTGTAVVTHSAEPFKDTHWLFAFIHKSQSAQALFEVTLASFILKWTPDIETCMA